MTFARPLLILVALLACPPAPNPSEATLPIVVRPTELDVNEHVNNAKYVEYFQWGRWAWLEGAGFDRDRLVAMGCVPVTVSMTINWRRPAKLNDRLDVVTMPEPPIPGGKSYRFRQEVRRGGELVADSVVTIANYSPKLGKSVPVPDELARALGGSK